MIIHGLCVTKFTGCVSATDLNNCSFSPAALSAICLLQLCASATQRGVRAALRQDSKACKALLLPFRWFRYPPTVTSTFHVEGFF